MKPSDLYQSPQWVMRPLFPHLRGKVVWEPACGDGNLLTALRRAHISYIGSDIRAGEPGVAGYKHDFLGSVPQVNCDVIATNPPYSIKTAFIKHCYEIGKPWALLMPIHTLEGTANQAMFEEHGLELILMPWRVKYYTDGVEQPKPNFASAWFTWRLGLPQQLNYWSG